MHTNSTNTFSSHKAQPRAAIYARVSTLDQSCELQLSELRDFCRRSGWEPVEYFENASARPGRKRPEFERMMTDARRRKFDIIVVSKMDRFSRSVHELVASVQMLDLYGVRFVVPSQGIDTDPRGPMGKLVLHLFAAFSEFEADLIAERVIAGIRAHQRAVAEGRLGKSVHTKSGRDLPTGRPRKIFNRDTAAKLRASGMSWRDIGTKMGIPESTIRFDLMARAKGLKLVRSAS